MRRNGEEKRILNIVIPMLLILGLIGCTIVYQLITSNAIRQRAHWTLTDESGREPSEQEVDRYVQRQLVRGYIMSGAVLVLSGALLIFTMSVNRRKNLQLAREKERLRRSEELYRALERFTDGIVFEGDVESDTLKFNQSFYDKLGRYPDICKLSHVCRPNNFIYSADYAAWAAFGRDLKNRVPTASCEVRVSNANGVYTWFRPTYTLIYHENGAPDRLVGKMSDIDESKRSMLKLRTQAETDSLTGILNHEATKVHINEFLKGPGEGGAHALFIIDLDNFKNVNDIFGHFEGDRTLMKVTKELQNVFRSTDVIGRIGGDEFVVLVKNIASDQLLRLKAAELCEMLQFTHTAANGEGEEGKVELSVTSSVGVSRYTPGCAKGFDTLYKEADEALYIAKKRGKSRYVIHDDENRCDSADKQAKPAAPSNVLSANIQLRALLEHMDGGVLLIEVGEKLRALYISPGFYTITNTTPDIAKKYACDLSILVREEDRPLFERALREGASKGRTADVVYRGVQWRGRSDTWWHLRGGFIDYQDSESPVIVAVVTDVTTIKNTSEELRLSKLRLSLAFSQTNMILCELDIKTRELKAWDTNTEKDLEQVAMTDAPMPAIAAKRIHPDSAGAALEFFNRIYAGEAEGSAVLKLRNLTDVYGWYKVSFKSMLSQDGKPYKAVGVMESVPAIVDIKSRFENEENFAAEFSYLLVATSKFNLTRNRVELMWSSDRRLYGNSRVATYDDLCAVLRSVMTDEDECAQAQARFNHQALIRAFERGGQATGEYRYIRADGSESWASYCVNLLLDPVTGDLYGFGYLRDVKLRKELELQLEGPVTRCSMTCAYAQNTARQFADTFISLNEQKDDFCGMLLIKLNGFGPAKEQMGYSMANQLLISIARLLLIRFDSEDVVGRTDDDGYTVFFPSIVSSEWLEDMADAVLSMLDAAGISNALPATVTYSLGGAIARLSDASYARLVSLSEQSLQVTKRQKRNRYTISVGVGK